MLSVMSKLRALSANKSSFTACLGVLLLGFSQPAHAEADTVIFAPTTEAIPSPERGFYVFEDSDFLNSDASSVTSMREARELMGYQLVFAFVRLDAWRDADLTPEFLNQLETGLANARTAGVKLILRFSYNNGPVDDVNSPDAPLERVRKHIRQVAPILRRNSDTLAVIQAGFIGQWGEGSYSTNNLTSDRNKAAIRNALLTRFPPEIPLQWRRPPDLLAWTAEQRGRFGFHNDCFMASPTDAGTWTGTPRQQARQRAFAERVTDRTPFTAETCVIEEATPRLGCFSVLTEGRQYHLTSLNADFHPDFINSWTEQGCLELVERHLGYRLQLDYAVIDPATRGITVWVTNDGWSRLHSDRPLRATIWRRGNERASVELGPKLLGAIGPGETVAFSGRLRPMPRSNDEVCLSSPEPIETGRDVDTYAVRFANADVPEQSGWSTERAAFCFTVP